MNNTAKSFIERHGLNMQLFADDEAKVAEEVEVEDKGAGTPEGDSSENVDLDPEEQEEQKPSEEEATPESQSFEINGKTYDQKALTDMVNNYQNLQGNYTQGQQKISELEKRMEDFAEYEPLMEKFRQQQENPEKELDFSGDPELKAIYDDYREEIRRVKEEKDEEVGSLKAKVESMERAIDSDTMARSFKEAETAIGRELTPEERDTLFQTTYDLMYGGKGNPIKVVAESMFGNDVKNMTAAQLQARLEHVSKLKAQTGSAGMKGSTKVRPPGAEEIAAGLELPVEVWDKDMM
jgi:hypothetical protein